VLLALAWRCYTSWRPPRWRRSFALRLRFRLPVYLVLLAGAKIQGSGCRV
jgi:hypothetical protein